MTEQTKDEDRSQAQTHQGIATHSSARGGIRAGQSPVPAANGAVIRRIRGVGDGYFDIYFHAHDMVVSVDTETEKVLQCNRAVMETLDYSRAEIVGNSIFQLYHQDCNEDAKELFSVITEIGEIHDAEQTLRKEMGEKSM